LTDEKVLDIPAFDMTEAAPNAVQSPSTGAKKAKTNRKRSGRPDGSVGRATFDAVNQMTADGTRTKQAAFIEYGQRTNTKPGTVSANYYRVARAKGTSKPRKPRLATARATTRPAPSTPRKPGRRGRPNSSTDVETAVRNLLANVETLVAVLKHQQAETTALQQQLDGLKDVL
jgi:hypothetical protein